MSPGEIYRHDCYYHDPQTGECKAKFLLVMAAPKGGDVIYRLLTSRQHGRPKEPRCYHGDPYPGFFLGALGGALKAESWVTLSNPDDLDADLAEIAVRRGKLNLVGGLARPLLRQAIDCAARADDTTTYQSARMLDVLATL